MLFFWENVIRYPRFFITSVAGLLIILLAPFQKLAKNSNILFLITVLLMFSLLIITLTRMLDL